jgi:WD40 repeat protein
VVSRGISIKGTAPNTSIEYLAGLVLVYAARHPVVSIGGLVRARQIVYFLFFVAIAGLSSAAAHAQQACPPPPAPTIKPGSNMFNMQQEMDLGDAMTEQFQREYHVIDDPALTAYLQRVGDRLAEHLPPGSLKYRFVVYDQPVANAFGTTGGRIYVSRKLIGFVSNEDELAGLLGHEMGHMVAHQTAIQMTWLFQKVLGVNSVSDRQDIFQKYNQMQDTAAKKQGVLANASDKEEPNQIVADHLGLYLASTSGYDPKALIQFWDRFARTKGKTGGFLSDLFGSTRPEERRLREMENVMPSLPGACGAPRQSGSPAEFEAWKSAVMNYTGLGHRESLHGVIFEQELNPPLRGDIKFLRFSPDGKYALAQDDSSVYVLTRDPFQFVFRIDAPDAYPAMFSSDSQTLSFYTGGLRVETWNLGDESRTALHDIVLQHECTQTELSPDGRFLACEELEPAVRLDTQERIVGIADIHVFDVATGQAVFEKKAFSQPPLAELFELLFSGGTVNLWSRLDTMRFSPDARYFVVSSHAGESVAVDLTTNKAIPLPGAIKNYLEKEFVFIGPDKIAGVNLAHANESGIVRFPSGEVVEQFPLGIQNIEAPAHGNYILLRPIDKYAMGLMDLETKKIFMADAQPAFDVFDSVALVTHLNGEIALKSVSTRQETAKLTLPRGPLAPLRAMALSPDMKWLAVSERSRGAVWDLTKNERPFYVRGFEGAYFGPDGSLYADFPKFQEAARAMGQLNVNTRASVPAYKVEDKFTDQLGNLLIVRKPNGKDGRIVSNVTLDVRNAVTGTTLWTRVFPQEMPGIHVSVDSSTVALAWRLSSTAAGNEIKADADLAKRVAGVKRDERNYLIEILDAHTGKSLGGLAVDTNNGSFTIQNVVAVGDFVILSDNLNRVFVYSLSSGQQTAKVFGRSPEASVASGVLAATNEAGQMLLFNLVSMEKFDELQFPSVIAMYRFSADGKRLFVLTAAQTAYVFDVAALSKKATVSNAAQ